MAVTGIFYLNGATLDRLNIGDAMVFASALFWGLQVFLLGLLARETRMPVTISVASFFVTGLFSMTIAFGFEAPTLDGIGAGWVELLYAGILSTAVAYSLQAIGQQHVPPANAAIILSAESLFAALGGALLLGERLPPVGYVGAGLIFLAILIVETVPALRQRRAPTGGT
jgi:drug/metabolite transporter (DMT)-like permease